MKIKKQVLTHENFTFEPSFRVGRSIRFDFQSHDVKPNQFFPNKDREVGGFFEINKSSPERFRIMFLLWPYDMISDGQESDHISYLKSLNVNALEIKSRSENVTKASPLGSGSPRCGV